MSKFINIALLLDFYGNLLTDRQKLIMTYHYEHDMSLSEISENKNISRQAVYDIIKRSENILYGYEEKLGLINKFQNNKDLLKELKNLISDDEFCEKNKDKAIDIIDQLISI